MESQESKQQIKDYFVEIKEDKFTKVKTIQCLHKIEWKGKELENKFMLTKDSYSNSLSMSIDYRHKDDIDSMFLGFAYSNRDGGYPGMTNIKMYLILDDDKTIELSDASGFDHASQSSKIGDNYVNVYIETAQLAVSMSDFIAIANAKKIEYSIRFGQGSLENTFTDNDLLVFKGFYNAAFDNEFELDNLYNYCAKESHTKSLLSSSRFEKNIFDKDKTILLIQNDSGLLSFWPSVGKNAVLFDDLQVGIKMNSASKAPDLLIFPTAIVFRNDSQLEQLNYHEISSIELQKSTLQIESGGKTYKLNFVMDVSLAQFVNNYLSKQLYKEAHSVDYISQTTIEEKENINTLLIRKYNISEADLLALKEIETEKSNLGMFSLKKEKLKSESLRILKPYNVKFMDLGMLLNEIKNM